MIVRACAFVPALAGFGLAVVISVGNALSITVARLRWIPGGGGGSGSGGGRWRRGRGERGGGDGARATRVVDVVVEFVFVVGRGATGKAGHERQRLGTTRRGKRRRRTTAMIQGQR